MKIEEKDLALFKTFEGRQFYAIPKKVFDALHYEEIEIVAEAEELIKKKIEEKAKKEAELAEKKRVAEEALKLKQEEEARKKAAEDIKLALEQEKAEKAAKKAQLLAELNELED